MRPACLASVLFFFWLATQFGGLGAQAQTELNPADVPHYGRAALAPGFSPTPLTVDLLSGGDVAVKPLRLGPNCLGYAASAPDYVVELQEPFERITFLNASQADTTLIINLPNGSWSCNDDTNGLNPALVYFNAPPGAYQIWIGSYAADSNDESRLYISETGPETLPTTATGPDPGREPLYGETTLGADFGLAPFTVQILGGGRNQVADYISAADCQGFVAEAPDFSVLLSESLADVWFSLHSPADMLLLINGADGAWHCSAAARIAFEYALAGLYDVWVGSAEEGNYAAGILAVSQAVPADAGRFTIDTSCPGLPATDLRLGARAYVAAASNALYAVPETAATQLFDAPAGTALTLVGGPVCREEERWWRTELGDGSRGWLRDGAEAARWLALAD